MDQRKEEYIVLFTHQKTKKSKVWQDGRLCVTNGRVELFDDCGKKLENVYCKPEQIGVGEQLETDRRLITIEENHRPSLNGSPKNVPVTQKSSLEQIDRKPIKRRMGFTVPRSASQQLAAPQNNDVLSEKHSAPTSLSSVKITHTSQTASTNPSLATSFMNMYEGIQTESQVQDNKENRHKEGTVVSHVPNKCQTSQNILRGEENSSPQYIEDNKTSGKRSLPQVLVLLSKKRTSFQPPLKRTKLESDNIQRNLVSRIKSSENSHQCSSATSLSDCVGNDGPGSDVKMTSEDGGDSTLGMFDNVLHDCDEMYGDVPQPSATCDVAAGGRAVDAEQRSSQHQLADDVTPSITEMFDRVHDTKDVLQELWIEDTLQELCPISCEVAAGSRTNEAEQKHADTSKLQASQHQIVDNGAPLITGGFYRVHDTKDVLHESCIKGILPESCIISCYVAGSRTNHVGRCHAGASGLLSSQGQVSDNVTPCITEEFDRVHDTKDVLPESCIQDTLQVTCNLSNITGPDCFQEKTGSGIAGSSETMTNDTTSSQIQVEHNVEQEEAPTVLADELLLHSVIENQDPGDDDSVNLPASHSVKSAEGGVQDDSPTISLHPVNPRVDCLESPASCGTSTSSQPTISANDDSVNLPAILSPHSLEGGETRVQADCPEISLPPVSPAVDCLQVPASHPTSTSSHPLIHLGENSTVAVDLVEEAVFEPNSGSTALADGTSGGNRGIRKDPVGISTCEQIQNDAQLEVTESKSAVMETLPTQLQDNLGRKENAVQRINTTDQATNDLRPVSSHPLSEDSKCTQNQVVDLEQPLVNVIPTKLPDTLMSGEKVVQSLVTGTIEQTIDDSGAVSSDRLDENMEFSEGSFGNFINACWESTPVSLKEEIIPEASVDDSESAGSDSCDTEERKCKFEEGGQCNDLLKQEFVECCSGLNLPTVSSEVMDIGSNASHDTIDVAEFQVGRGHSITADDDKDHENKEGSAQAVPSNMDLSCSRMDPNIATDMVHSSRHGGKKGDATTHSTEGRAKHHVSSFEVSHGKTSNSLDMIHSTKASGEKVRESTSNAQDSNSERCVTSLNVSHEQNTDIGDSPYINGDCQPSEAASAKAPCSTGMDAPSNLESAMIGITTQSADSSISSASVNSQTDGGTNLLRNATDRAEVTRGMSRGQSDIALSSSEGNNHSQASMQSTTSVDTMDLSLPSSHQDVAKQVLHDESYPSHLKGMEDNQGFVAQNGNCSSPVMGSVKEEDNQEEMHCTSEVGCIEGNSNSLLVTGEDISSNSQREAYIRKEMHEKLNPRPPSGKTCCSTEDRKDITLDADTITCQKDRTCSIFSGQMASVQHKESLSSLQRLSQQCSDIGGSCGGPMEDHLPGNMREVGSGSLVLEHQGEDFYHSDVGPSQDTQVIGGRDQENMPSVDLYGGVDPVFSGGILSRNTDGFTDLIHGSTERWDCTSQGPGASQNWGEESGSTSNKDIPALPSQNAVYQPPNSNLHGVSGGNRYWLRPLTSTVVSRRSPPLQSPTSRDLEGLWEPCGNMPSSHFWPDTSRGCHSSVHSCQTRIPVTPLAPWLPSDGVTMSTAGYASQRFDQMSSIVMDQISSVADNLAFADSKVSSHSGRYHSQFHPEGDCFSPFSTFSFNEAWLPHVPVGSVHCVPSGSQDYDHSTLLLHHDRPDQGSLFSASPHCVPSSSTHKRGHEDLPSTVLVHQDDRYGQESLISRTPHCVPIMSTQGRGFEYPSSAVSSIFETPGFVPSMSTQAGSPEYPPSAVLLHQDGRHDQDPITTESPHCVPSLSTQGIGHGYPPSAALIQDRRYDQESSVLRTPQCLPSLSTPGGGNEYQPSPEVVQGGRCNQESSMSRTPHYFPSLSTQGNVHEYPPSTVLVHDGGFDQESSMSRTPQYLPSLSTRGKVHEYPPSTVLVQDEEFDQESSMSRTPQYLPSLSTQEQSHACLPSPALIEEKGFDRESSISRTPQCLLSLSTQGQDPEDLPSAVLLHRDERCDLQSQICRTPRRVPLISHPSMIEEYPQLITPSPDQMHDQASPIPSTPQRVPPSNHIAKSTFDLLDTDDWTVDRTAHSKASQSVTRSDEKCREWLQKSVDDENISLASDYDSQTELFMTQIEEDGNILEEGEGRLSQDALGKRLCFTPLISVATADYPASQMFGRRSEEPSVSGTRPLAVEGVVKEQARCVVETKDRQETHRIRPVPPEPAIDANFNDSRHWRRDPKLDNPTLRPAADITDGKPFAQMRRPPQQTECTRSEQFNRERVPRMSYGEHDSMHTRYQEHGTHSPTPDEPQACQLEDSQRRNQSQGMCRPCDPGESDQGRMYPTPQAYIEPGDHESMGVRGGHLGYQGHETPTSDRPLAAQLQGPHRRNQHELVYGPNDAEDDNKMHWRAEPTTSAAPRQSFKAPVASGLVHEVDGKNICGDLVFPSIKDVSTATVPQRQVPIPASFKDARCYKQTLTAALKEHINIVLYEVAYNFFSALSKVDVSGYSSFNPKGSSSSDGNPPCQHKQPSKRVCVKKDGPNKGRFFYACGKPRADQCKFFQWADQGSTQGSNRPSCKEVLNDSSSIEMYLKSFRVSIYCECQLLHKSMFSDSMMPGAPTWIKKYRQKHKNQDKKKLYLKLSRKELSSVYGKDDLWAISKDLSYGPGDTFLARSVFHGPNAASELEIEPMSGYSPSNWTNQDTVYAIHCCNASTELSCLANLQFVNPQTFPLLPALLTSDPSGSSSFQQSQTGSFRSPSVVTPKAKQLCCSEQQILDLARDTTTAYHLNGDQSEALMNVAHMFVEDPASPNSPISLIHGVFGAGKSYLLAVTVLFLHKLFQLHRENGGASDHWKVLISSTTNVAVDRILLSLLDLGFEELIRVGSIRKIAKPVLPYSVHASDKNNQELKELQAMLKGGDLSTKEKSFVRRSIERQRQGINREMLSKVSVVGVTCAACSFPCISNLRFPVVLLDECSQITEPACLLPVARFECSKLVLVGDPNQLDPTIQGSEASHRHGLEQTMFDRLLLMGHEPTLLRTQYRCHPDISAIANQLFYDNRLLDGVTGEDRQQIADGFPTVCFYNVAGGRECRTTGGSFLNDKEGEFVVTMIETLLVKGVEPSQIGVITLYKAQMAHISTLMQQSRLAKQQEVKAIQISTVDAFQGGEKDIIILSCVRSDFMGFAASDKRTNVALTRSRNHLLIVGNERMLAADNLWSRVLEKCREYKGIKDSAILLKEWRVLLDEEKQNSQTQKSTKPPPVVKKKTPIGRAESSSPPLSLESHRDEDVTEVTSLATTATSINSSLPYVSHPGTSDHPDASAELPSSGRANLGGMNKCSLEPCRASPTVPLLVDTPPPPKNRESSSEDELPSFTLDVDF